MHIIHTMLEASRNFERTPPPTHTENKPASVEEYEPQFKQIQEDLKYMFEIDIHEERELHSAEIKKKMYAKALQYLKMSNPFGLHYFFDKKLLTQDDIPESDMPALKTYATKTLASLKNINMRTEAENLFFGTGILTDVEIKALKEVQ